MYKRQAIGWAALGFFIGGLAGMFSISLVASKNVQRIAALERAGAKMLGEVTTLEADKTRLLGDLAGACKKSVELERERDKWRAESMKVIDVFTGPAWQDKAPGEAG